jgi:methionyl-tRNA formyltransferase
MEGEMERIASMRIVFIGTPDFAVASLEALIKAKKNVVAVITAPDKPAGRGKKIRESAVKRCAIQHDLPVLQPSNLKDEKFLENLSSYKADLQIVVAFRMLPKLVWDMPPLGTFNLHASLLPNYRGAAPINWAIINGETKTGVTTFLLKHEIDTGNILLQKECSILPEDNAGSLHDKLMHLGSNLVVETVDLFESGKINPIPQETLMKDEPKEAPKIFKENYRIDWNKPLEEVHNLIRGMSPYPTAFTEVKMGEKKYNLKIFKSEIEKSLVLDESILIQNDKIGVRLSDGILWLKEVQLEGKRRMDVADFLRGLNDKLEIIKS